MHHTRSSSFEGNVGVVYPKSAQMTGLHRDDRGRADSFEKVLVVRTLTVRTWDLQGSWYIFG